MPCSARIVFRAICEGGDSVLLYLHTMVGHRTRVEHKFEAVFELASNFLVTSLSDAKKFIWLNFYYEYYNIISSYKYFSHSFSLFFLHPAFYQVCKKAWFLTSFFSNSQKFTIQMALFVSYEVMIVNNAALFSCLIVSTVILYC